VLAATFASLNDTEDGSFLNADAVLSAACFCANVVPSDGLSDLGDAAVSRENRDCNSFNWGDAFVCAVGDFVGEFDAGGGNGGFLPSIPNPGTDTPAAPNLSSAPWFIIPLCVSGSVEVYLGGELIGVEFCRGGSRGGRLGGFPFVADVGGGNIGLRPSAPSFLAGGGGR